MLAQNCAKADLLALEVVLVDIHLDGIYLMSVMKGFIEEKAHKVLLS